MPNEPQRFRLNAPGDFYVEDGMCIACAAPQLEAPELISHTEDGESQYHCYFHRQPATPLEVEHAIQAVFVSCCEAVQYGGRDPAILARLTSLGSGGPNDVRRDDQ
jgi:hypothetical protein